MDLKDRIAITYHEAMKHQHTGARVEIHIGADVQAALRAMAEQVAGWQPPVTMSFWGFPVVYDRMASPDHISVHTVQTIS